MVRLELIQNNRLHNESFLRSEWKLTRLLFPTVWKLARNMIMMVTENPVIQTGVKRTFCYVADFVQIMMSNIGAAQKQQVTLLYMR